MPVDLTPFANAVRQLAAGLNMSRAHPDNEVIRDGVIQRFEYTYELSRKTLRRYLMATEPSAAISRGPHFPIAHPHGIRTRLCSRAVGTAWTEFRKARGTTSQAHDGIEAAEVFAAIPSFLGGSRRAPRGHRGELRRTMTDVDVAPLHRTIVLGTLRDHAPQPLPRLRLRLSGAG